MPLGLFLKSEPYGSALSSATRGYDIAAYSRLHGFDDYVDRIKPLSLERFLGYADWFTRELVPGVRDLTVTGVTPDGGGFKVEFAEAPPVLARQVVIATGLLPYAHVPAELSGLPAGLMTHSSAHRELGQFSGRRVAVIGGGQSALQTAALLHEAGADARLIVRRDQVVWNEPLHPQVRLRDYVLRPPAKLCEGWGCVVADSPTAFRLLPGPVRVDKALNSFGPHGAWWLRDRVEGVVEVLAGRRLTSAEPRGSGVRLHLDGPGQATVDADHVIAGTGFRIDLARLPFLPGATRAALTTRAGFPLVNRAGETSVPGLYFAGAPTMISLGPGVRFISGTHHTAARLARSIAHRARKGKGPVDPAVAEDSPQPRAAGTEAAPVS